MSYVGMGGGSWVQETTYKYVGPGYGDFEGTWRQPGAPWCLGLVVLALVVVLVVLLVGVGGTTTTTVKSNFVPPIPTLPPAPPVGECIMWGDPHVQSFDGGMPNFYGEGEFGLFHALCFWGCLFSETPKIHQGFQCRVISLFEFSSYFVLRISNTFEVVLSMYVMWLGSRVAWAVMAVSPHVGL
jgi:hypothetical protein